MRIETLGQLMHWLLKTPRSPLDTLRATSATPEDLAAAISLMMARNHLCKPVLVGGRMLFRARATPQSFRILELPIAGCHQIHPYRDTRRMQPWIDAAIAESAREWKMRPGATSDDSDTAVRGETFLAARLGRRPTDREIRMFWHIVDAPESMTG